MWHRAHAATSRRSASPSTYTGTQLRPAHHAPHLLELRQPAIRRRTAASSSASPPQTATAATGSVPPAESHPTTTHPRTPGCAVIAASRSAGCMFSPRRSQSRRPCAQELQLASSPRARPGRPWPATRLRACIAPPCHVAPASISPRTRISPSSPMLHLASRQRFADRPRSNVERVIQRHQRGRLGHAIALDQRIPQPIPEASSSAGSVAPPEITAQNFQPSARCTRRNRHHLPAAAYARRPSASSANSAGSSGNRATRGARSNPSTRGPPPAPKSFAPHQLHQPRWLQLFRKVHLRRQQRRTHSPMNCPNTWLSGSDMQKAQRMKHPLVLPVLRHLRSIGPSVTSTLRCVCTIPSAPRSSPK